MRRTAREERNVDYSILSIDLDGGHVQTPRRVHILFDRARDAIRVLVSENRRLWRDKKRLDWVLATAIDDRNYVLTRRGVDAAMKERAKVVAHNRRLLRQRDRERGDHVV